MGDIRLRHRQNNTVDPRNIKRCVLHDCAQTSECSKWLRNPLYPRSHRGYLDHLNNQARLSIYLDHSPSFLVTQSCTITLHQSIHYPHSQSPLRDQANHGSTSTPNAKTMEHLSHAQATNTANSNTSCQTSYPLHQRTTTTNTTPPRRN